MDVTDDKVCQMLGIDKNAITKSAGAKEVIYDIPNTIAVWARKNKYNGIIAPGARGAKDYVNIILFDQNYIDTILKGKNANLIIK